MDYALKTLLESLNVSEEERARLQEENKRLYAERDELEKQLRQMSRNYAKFLRMKSETFAREHERELCIVLAKRLAPLFGFTIPENFEANCLRLLEKQEKLGVA